MNGAVHSFPDARQAALTCADYILGRLNEAIERSGRAMFAISGGSSPKPMFESLAKSNFAWDRVQLFWVDERAVPPSDDRSNFKLANESWLQPANFPRENIHRIRAELDPPEAARLYVDEIRRTFDLVPGDQAEFDVIHQGMGPEGHTASLFPGEPLLNDRRGIAAAVYVDAVKMWRITMLPAVLQAARHTAILVVGADKREALECVFRDEYNPQKCPAQILRGARDAQWFLAV